MKAIEWTLREGKALALLFLYFLFCYTIIVVSKKLILDYYNIDFLGFSLTVVAELVAAKAVLIIEHTPLARVLAGAPPYLKVLYDTGVYTAFGVVLLYLEKTLELMHKEGGFRWAFFTQGQEDHLSQFEVTILWAALSFLGYASFAALKRHLGPGALYRFFFTAPGKARDSL
jgi:hypothetical protein